jgi:copper chaperone CopZ
LLGRRTVLLYLLTIIISAVGAGLLLDWLLPAMQIKVPDLNETCHEAMKGGWAPASWAILLLAVLAYSYAATYRQKRKGTEEVVDAHSHGSKTSSRRLPPSPSSSGQRLELAIDGMTCNHCVAAVTRALKECHGVASVQIDLAKGRAEIVGEHLHSDQLVAAVAHAGYATRIVS